MIFYSQVFTSGNTSLSGSPTHKLASSVKFMWIYVLVWLDLPYLHTDIAWYTVSSSKQLVFSTTCMFPCKYAKRVHWSCDLSTDNTYTHDMHTQTHMLIPLNKPSSLGTRMEWWQKRYGNEEDGREKDENRCVPHICATHSLPHLPLFSSLFSDYCPLPPFAPVLSAVSTPLFTPLPPNTPQQNPSSSSQERWHTLRINLEMRCDPKAGTEKRKVETTDMYVWSHARTPMSQHVDHTCHAAQCYY